MTVHRYAVLDADGVKINTITADNGVVNSGWYPGYGAALVDEGIEPADPVPLPAPPKPANFSVLPPLSEPLSNGDRLDIATGEIIRAETAAEGAQ